MSTNNQCWNYKQVNGRAAMEGRHGGPPWRATASLENFLGGSLGGPKFLQILCNANDRFHRLF